MEDASGTDQVRCGEMVDCSESSVPGVEVVVRGNPAGMNSCGDRLHSSKRAVVLGS